jgi:hypothetical protein
MEAAAAEQEAAIKCRSEKGLSTSGAFPVCQPGGNEEVGNKCYGKEKSRNEKGESKFKHRGEEESKHHRAAPPISGPGVRILRIHPRSAGFV